MKPCILIKRNNRHEAFNEDGKMILTRPARAVATQQLFNYGYFLVTPTSRVASVIRNKVRGL